MYKLIQFTIILPLLVFGQIPEALLPAHSSADQIIRHTAYTLCYAEPYEQAQWVLYTISRDRLRERVAERGNDFRQDPAIKTGSALPEDYKGSGYDRGHLAPAADMAWSPTTMSESFFMSNMSPQAPSFNRGIWKKLEDQTRRWAQEYGELIVAVGPVLQSGLPAIGTVNRVAVPVTYYKIVYDNNTADPKMIGFIFDNEGSAEPLSSFAAPVDSIEKITGINFYPLLSVKAEKVLESAVHPDKWQFDEPTRVATRQNVSVPRKAGRLTENVIVDIIDNDRILSFKAALTRSRYAEELSDIAAMALRLIIDNGGSIEGVTIVAGIDWIDKTMTITATSEEIRQWHRGELSVKDLNTVFTDTN